MSKKSQNRLDRDRAAAPIVEESVTRREFSYTKGNVNLKYSLRVDVDFELEAFKELMVRGIEDIDKELHKQNKN